MCQRSDGFDSISNWQLTVHELVYLQERRLINYSGQPPAKKTNLRLVYFSYFQKKLPFFGLYSIQHES